LAGTPFGAASSTRGRSAADAFARGAEERFGAAADRVVSVALVAGMGVGGFGPAAFAALTTVGSGAVRLSFAFRFVGAAASAGSATVAPAATSVAVDDFGSAVDAFARTRRAAALASVAFGAGVASTVTATASRATFEVFEAAGRLDFVTGFAGWSLVGTGVGWLETGVANVSVFWRSATAFADPRLAFVFGGWVGVEAIAGSAAETGGALGVVAGAVVGAAAAGDFPLLRTELGLSAPGAAVCSGTEGSGALRETADGVNEAVAPCVVVRSRPGGDPAAGRDLFLGSRIGAGGAAASVMLARATSLSQGR
jgi:hypothetical protein